MLRVQARNPKPPKESEAGCVAFNAVVSGCGPERVESDFVGFHAFSTVSSGS
jgi:hypothetical protein